MGQRYWGNMNFLKSFILVMLVSLTSAGTLIWAKGGRAWGDFIPFVWWTLPFAVALGGVFAPFFRAKKESSFSSRVAASVVFGCIVGGAWVVLVRLLLGPWAALFSFPVGWCWIGAACSVTFVACSMPDRSVLRMGAVAVSIVLASSGLLYGIRYMLDEEPDRPSMIGSPMPHRDAHAF